jgi:hypothetical protein
MAVVNKMELGRELFKTISQINSWSTRSRRRPTGMGVDPLKAHDSAMGTGR